MNIVDNTILLAENEALKHQVYILQSECHEAIIRVQSERDETIHRLQSKHDEAMNRLQHERDEAVNRYIFVLQRIQQLTTIIEDLQTSK